MSTHSALNRPPGSGDASSTRESVQLAQFLYRPIIFQAPERVVQPPSWLEHVPFAFWIVDVLRPAVIVELGTHSGNSYAAFAQAVQMLGLSTAAYAVDTWRGDPQAGFYDEEVFEEWSGYHDRHFSAFSRLIRSTFEEAVQHFSDGSIDLLHIDGCHTYEAASTDLALWRPKLSRRGVILIHDINVREGDFGAWRLWEELKAQSPSFEFLHGHGLGVVAAGPDMPEALRWLFSRSMTSSTDESAVRQLFAQLGGLVSARFAATDAASKLRAETHASGGASRERRRTPAGRRVSRLASELSLLKGRLATISAELDARTVQATEARRLKAGLAAQLAAVSADLHARTMLATETQRDKSERTARLPTVSADLDPRTIEATEAQGQQADLVTQLASVSADLAARIAQDAEARRQTAEMVAQLETVSAALDSRAIEATQTKDRIADLEDQLTRQSKEHGEALRRMTELTAGLLERLRGERGRRRSIEQERDRLAAASRIQQTTAIRRRISSLRAGWRRRLRYVRKISLTSAALGLLPTARRGAYRSALTFLTHPTKLREAHDVVVSGLFDEAYYSSCYPDVRASRLTPLAHFVLKGVSEGRNPHPLFDTAYYLRRNPDVAAAAVNPLIHYRAQGAFEGRSPHPLFDVAYYLDTHPDVRSAGIEPLTHFLGVGAVEGRNPSPFFDCSYYLRLYPDVGKLNMNPLSHFVRHGWREGRRPSAAFDTAYYLSQHDDVRLQEGNPLSHYVEYGRFEHRSVAANGEERSQLDEPVTGLPHITLKARSIGPARVDRPTVLCLSHVMPWPPRAGNEYRIYRMLRWLRDQGYRVVPVIAPLPGACVETDALHALAAEFSNAVLCNRDGRLEYVLQDVPDVLASLNGGLTRPVAALLDEGAVQDAHARQLLQMDRTFCHDAMITAVLRLQQVLGPHVLLTEYIWMSRILPLVSGDVVKVIDTIDVFSTKREKVLQFGIDDLHVEPHEEAKRLRDADLILAIQDEERQELQQLVSGKRIVVAGVDFDVVEDAGTPSGRRVLYVASDNPMNIKGLLDFLRFAWPLIRRDVPDAELLLAGKVGGTLDAEVPGVIRLGPVADLRPLYSQARVVINPAVAGTGLKIKTLEALGHLRPIVAWPSGTDGFARELAAFCVTVQDWYDFSKRVAGLLATHEPPLFSQAERSTIIRLTSPATVYGEMTETVEFLLKERVGFELPRSGRRV